MMGAGSLLSGRSAIFQITLALLATAFIFVVYKVLGLPLAVTLAWLPLLLFMTLAQTFIITVVLACFSYFRLHEAYPFLEPLKLVSLAGAATVGGLLWRAFTLDGNRPRGQRELKILSLLTAGGAIGFGIAFSSSGGDGASPMGLLLGSGMIAFFCVGLGLWYHMLGRASAEGWPTTMFYMTLFMIIASLGVPLAKAPSDSFGHWMNVYWKIVIVAFAIAWLARREADFARALFLIIFSGVLIAGVAIYNKVNGIDLVEGTRVTIGLTLYKPDHVVITSENFRKYASSLGDPNELSMVLLFPLSFAIALVYYRPNRFFTILGALAAPALLLAIIFTQSRGGLLGVLAVGGLIGLRVVKSRALLIAAGLLAAVALYVAMGVGDRETTAAAEGEVIDDSSMGRVYAWTAAVKMGLFRPLTGVGMTAFQAAHAEYAIKLTGFNKEVHSTWFGILGETGLPGLTVFILMIISAVRSSLDSLRRLELLQADRRLQALALGLVAGLGGSCVAGAFLTHGFTWPLYIQIALTIALWRCARKLELDAARQGGLPTDPEQNEPAQPPQKGWRALPSTAVAPVGADAFTPTR
ncbi:MAG: O-antigen ligase family protein [Neomegalonema sp.]|nr:O-antigen ligase family protein [Neomegalonema sp.]